jgi:type II secretory pathway pseudopilin PulG
MKSLNRKGIALYLVLAVLIIVIIFANIILSSISSQSQFTYHRVRRIQAYYAAQAGINAAFEGLKANDTAWVPDPITSARTVRICQEAQAGCNFNDTDLPASINFIDITIGPQDANGMPINAAVNYASD